jgi:succinate dehydrogenase/fumarate reductase flavoprotein subunit
VDFSWKEHFTETTRVGDEGTDEELETIFQHSPTTQ